MAYPSDRNSRYLADTTQIVESCQPLSSRFITSPIVKQKKPDTPFGQRLREVFGGVSNTEILKRLKGRVEGINTDSALSNYMSGGRYPDAEKLIAIAQIVECNLHYLLTGEGEPGGTFENIAEPERTIIQRIAPIYGLEVEQIINDLLREALLARGVGMFERYRHLQADQRAELDVIYTLLRDELGADSKQQTAPRRAG